MRNLIFEKDDFINAINKAQGILITIQQNNAL